MAHLVCSLEETLSHADLGHMILRHLDHRTIKGLRLVSKQASAAINATIKHATFTHSGPLASFWPPPHETLSLLPKLPTLKRVCLRVNDKYKACTLIKVLAQIQLPSLLQAAFPFSYLDAAAAAALAQAPWSQQLRRLSLALQDAKSAAALTKAGWPSLKVLKLRTRLSSCIAVMASLAKLAWPNLQAVHLYTDSNPITSYNAQVVTAIIRNRAWVQGLRVLVLESCGIGEEGVTALALVEWSELRRLDISFNNVGPQAAVALAAVHMPKLDTLQLRNNGLRPAGVAALGNAPWLRHLRMLSLASNALGRSGAAAVTELDMPALLCLSLENNDLGPDAAAVLATAQWPPSLYFLNMRCNPIAAGGANALARANWPHLRCLDLVACELDLGSDEATRAEEALKEALPAYIISSHADYGGAPAGFDRFHECFSRPYKKESWDADNESDGE